MSLLNSPTQLFGQTLINADENIYLALFYKQVSFFGIKKYPGFLQLVEWYANGEDVTGVKMLSRTTDSLTALKTFAHFKYLMNECQIFETCKHNCLSCSWRDDSVVYL